MNLSNEYIRGLVEGEGCFSFHVGYKRPNGSKYKLPAFVLSMNFRDRDLLNAVRDKMGIKNKLYYKPPSKNIQNTKNGKIYESGRMAILVVRDFEQLKNIVIPFFYKKLRGHKAKQFEAWLEKIGSDSDISDRFRSLHGIYKMGLYDKELNFTERFKD